MSGDSKKEEGGSVGGDVPNTEQIKKKKKKIGVFSRIFRGIFRSNKDDFEKRLEYISKEEAAILSRMKRRSHSVRGMTKNLIFLSLALEVVAVGFAITTTRSLKLSWQMRAMRVLPMFLLPGLTFLFYSALARLTRMCDRRDENNLENLRAERQEKIDELKERTNYYVTQQLIQRYDPDPAAQAAAASVLASKLGADSGMKVYLGEEMLSAPKGKSIDLELVQPGGLRNRKHTRAESVDGTLMDHPDSGMLQTMELEGISHHQTAVEHYQPTDSSTHDGSWISRLAALLVGEDPTQSYALICGNCHIHNGLARKEDYPYITYYCPHCKVLNRPKEQGEFIPDPSSLPTSRSSVAGVAGSITDIDKESKDSGVGVLSTGSPTVAAGEGINRLSSVTDAASSISDMDKDSKGSMVDTISTSSPTAAAGEGITSASAATDTGRSIAGVDEDRKGSVVDTMPVDTIPTGSPVATAGSSNAGIDEDSKGPAVDTIPTGSPVATAGSSIADTDEDTKRSAVDTISTSSPVAAAGEGVTSLSSVTDASTSVVDIVKYTPGSMVDTLSTGSPVAAAGEESTEVESISPEAPSNS